MIPRDLQVVEKTPIDLIPLKKKVRYFQNMQQKNLLQKEIDFKAPTRCVGYHFIGMHGYCFKSMYTKYLENRKP